MFLLMQQLNHLRQDSLVKFLIVTPKIRAYASVCIDLSFSWQFVVLRFSTAHNSVAIFTTLKDILFSLALSKRAWSFIIRKLASLTLVMSISPLSQIYNPFQSTI